MSAAVLRRLAAALVIALLPVAVTAGVCGYLFEASPRWAIPYVNDEVAYWNQIATFRAAGFDGGYATVDEQPSRVAFSHFGPHGPGFPVLYGGIAKAVGWDYASGPLFGAVLFVVAAFTFVVIAQSSLPATALLFTSFWPVILSLPNTMQEPLHFAWACFLASLVVKTLRNEQPSPGILAACAGAITVASLVRPAWGLLLPGLAWLVLRPRGRAWGYLGLVVGFAACVVLLWIFMTLAAPYRSTDVVTSFAQHPLDTTIGIMRRLLILSPARFLSLGAETLEIVFRYELIAFGILAFAIAHRATDAARRVHAFAWITTLALVGAVLGLGSIGSWQDYRATTPILFMLLLTCAAARSVIVWPAILVHLAITLVAVATFQDFQGDKFESDRTPGIEAFARDVRTHITYDGTLSPWGNTVLVGVERYQYQLLGLPGGIGASAALSWEDVPTPPRSRYLLLAPNELQALNAQIRLRKLADTALGELYENLDWQR
jgi:hypothetical protein